MSSISASRVVPAIALSHARAAADWAAKRIREQLPVPIAQQRRYHGGLSISRRQARMPVELLFALLRNPASTGAVLPSSRRLANAMASAAVGADAVVELGAGTGPVTEALLRRLPGVPLIAVELQAPLARACRRASRRWTCARPRRSRWSTA
jgi:predicted O-methyltransferase YrrM